MAITILVAIIIALYWFWRPKSTPGAWTPTSTGPCDAGAAGAAFPAHGGAGATDAEHAKPRRDTETTETMETQGTWELGLKRLVSWLDTINIY